MKKRIGAVLAVMALAVAMLSGCKGEGGAENADVKIFYSSLESSEYHVNLAEMALSKAETEGIQLDVESAEASIEIQAEHIKKAVAGDYDAIICSLVSPDAATELKAIAGDVPIVFINSAPDEKVLVEDQIVYVASDEVVAGQYQAEYVLNKLSNKNEINVVLFKGQKGHSATEGRTDGAKQVLEASGKKINYVFDDYGNFVKDTAQEMMELFLKTDTPIDCVICNNDDMALGAIEACKKAGIDITNTLFLGIDASANGCEAIKDGTMAFSVYQSTKGQTEAAVDVAIKLANGGSIQEMDGATEEGKYVWIPFEKVDSSNVSQYITE